MRKGGTERSSVFRWPTHNGQAGSLSYAEREGIINHHDRPFDILARAVCGLLLCATMLNYMDRTTLAQLAKTIGDEYLLTNEQYGLLDFGFSLAFASGGLFFGVLWRIGSSALALRRRRLRLVRGGDRHRVFR